jgi:hypothetical protein
LVNNALNLNWPANGNLWGKFPNLWETFPKVSRKFPKVREVSRKAREKFPKGRESFANSREFFPKVSEKFPKAPQRLPKAGEPAGNLADVTGKLAGDGVRGADARKGDANHPATHSFWLSENPECAIVASMTNAIRWPDEEWTLPMALALNAGVPQAEVRKQLSAALAAKTIVQTRKGDGKIPGTFQVVKAAGN